MKNNYWVPALLLSIAFVVAGYFIGNLQVNGKKYDRYVTVKGLSEREVAADLAVWPINVILTGNDLEQLRREIEAQNQEVNTFFNQQGFGPEEITRGPVNINDVQANPYNSGATTSRYRYMAKSEFTLRTADVAKLQIALSESLKLLSRGIVMGSKNEWEPIEYIFTGLNALKPEMVEEATKNARQVAEKFARDSNSEVGQIRIARQGLFSIANRDANTPQIKNVRVVTTIDFQLED
ncbi:MAG: SIMPL domain-containing protein [Robiginitalea sp.]|uniref:SIMPL domain-containing protein n=1 Tax=Robiginitalea sp. TaxID=1902411 RepID=UPI003C795CA6